MIKNNYLFSSRFTGYLKSQKIENEVEFKGFAVSVRSFLKSGIGGDAATSERTVSSILALLQFACPPLKSAGHNNYSKYCYLYDRFPLDKKVSCLYFTAAYNSIDATQKGNFPAFELIRLLKKENLEWGILTDGSIWRLYSTLSPLPYENYLEIDFEEFREENFRIFWQLFSLNLFIPDENDVTPLERYIEESEKEAAVIETHIRKNIDEILENICFGFLSFAGKDKHPLSDADKQLYFENAVYLLFRLLFVSYAESRNLLPVENPAYQKISLNSLMEKAGHARKAGLADPEGVSLWDLFRDLCIAIEFGQSDLEIPEYDGGLFDSAERPFLDDPGNKLKNMYFSTVLYRLGYLEKGRRVIKIQYKDLSVRSLGSLYEGILEYKLFIAEQDMVFRGKKIIPVAKAGKITKNARVIYKGHVYFSQDAEKRHDTGAYYTPEDVVNYMVQNSVRLGLEERWMEFLPEIGKYEIEIRNAVTQDIQKGLLKKADREILAFIEKRLLTFKVMDPAMGSGHFLVNALNTIAHFIIEVLQTQVQISDGPVKHAKNADTTEWPLVQHHNVDIDSSPALWRRRVVEKCIFGIDINPLSVELAKLSLWIASADAGKPLTFLNHHLKCGDSVMGVRLQDMLTYPQKKKSDKEPGLWDSINKKIIAKIKNKFQRLLSSDSDEIRDILSKKDEYEEIQADPFLNHLKDMATLWLIISFDLHGPKKRDLFADKNNPLPDEKTYFKLLEQAQRVESEEEWIGILGQSLYNRIKAFHQSKDVFHWEAEFPEIIDNGFETVVGNPPYVDVKEADFRGVALHSLKSRNLYAYIPERGFAHLKKNHYLSFITPIAVICSKRMVHLQKVFKEHTWYVINFDSASNPGTLFKNVKARITIFILKKDSEKRILTTNQIRFFQHERKKLFVKNKLHLLENQKLILDYTIPKIATKIEEQILETLFAQGKTLDNFLASAPETGHILYYRRLGGPYYLYAFDTPPFLEVNGKQVISSTLSSVNLATNACKNIQAAVFYSSLYYWFWTVYSDCYDLSPKELYRFPLDIEKLTQYETQFEDLFHEIMEDLRNHSEMVTYNKAKGVTRYEMFRPRKSKPIFDKVDRLLGGALGFTDEMAEFIINYDIKYRTDTG
jgi:hypothetical protein